MQVTTYLKIKCRFMNKIAKVKYKLSLSPKSDYRRQTGWTILDTLAGSVITAIVSALAISLINSSLDGVSNMNRRSLVRLAMMARMEEIRTEAFKLHCTAGCSDDEVDKNLQYDESAIVDACSNQTFGNSLLTNLQENSVELTENFNVQDYNTGGPSIEISTSLTSNGNKLVASFVETTTNTNTSSSIVPNALGWC